MRIRENLPGLLLLIFAVGNAINTLHHIKVI